MNSFKFRKPQLIALRTGPHYVKPYQPDPNTIIVPARPRFGERGSWGWHRRKYPKPGLHPSDPVRISAEEKRGRKAVEKMHQRYRSEQGQMEGLCRIQERSSDALTAFISLFRLLAAATR